MSRSVFTIQYHCDFDSAQKTVESILQQKNFHTTTLKTGETVWKSGVGLMAAMKFIKIEYAPGCIQLSAWIQSGLGSISGGEMDLNGVVGTLPKKQLMHVVEKIMRSFQ